MKQVRGLANANVEIWHVDAAGNYSQYGGQATQTFLRGMRRAALLPAGIDRGEGHATCTAAL